ncbi:MAG: tRNA (N(6)-L-threonylcarbamoyladenosine(37)-C(2))-methylthiotransferase MtaB [Candidatus Krumholzibacteria bacterium]|nr:tRNA (N(6)-L-threonylcarbamoyladenosine(37)-C(2))-methylthiotransferase MtaB [Candidatus Krumholzibacteria bacterium]
MSELQDLRPLPTVNPAASGTGTPLRVAFWTLGCRLNQYDTEGIKTSMAGVYDIEVVNWNDPAHLYVLNSCTVTAKADQECRRLARQAKRRHPSSKVVVVGCYAQTQPDALAAVPEIDGIVGNTDKDDVPAWLPAVLDEESLTMKVEEFQEKPEFDSPLIDSFSGRSRAFVKIQDGCNLRCTYCLIWRARGPGRSRSVENVLAQLRLLVETGYPETILAGIHLGGYGRDLLPRVTLPDLLEICLKEIPGLRIRLSSMHPNEVTPRLLELFAADNRLRPHLHISLQSGSDAVLKRMQRPYRGERAWQAMRDVASTVPDFGIGADIIVGFPGETEAEFEETHRMVQELPFSYLHVFRFSRRPGTPAADMPDQVHPETISRRSQILRNLAQQKNAEFCRSLVGTTREAVIEAESGTHGWRQATTDNYVSILVPENSAGTIAAGSLVKVEINDFSEGELFASVREIIPAFSIPGKEV